MKPVLWTLDDLVLLEWAEQMKPRIDNVLAIRPEDHATSSRDYGRGFADAIKQIHAALGD